jgi:predicted dehydrogenase
MISVAVISLGNISGFHIEGFLRFPDRCKITHLVDIDPQKAEQKKKEYNLDAKVYASHKDILDDPDLDLVSIASPPFAHAGIAIDFLTAGKHVLVEKPMANSLEECDAMIAAARKNGKILSVVAQNRFRDSIVNLKKVLDSGIIGKITHVQANSYWWRGHSYYDLWWRGLWEKEGGGCTLNHAVHHIDMIAWMMGRPRKVSAMLSNAAHDNAEVEDISIAMMQYDGNALAQVTSSVIHHGEEQQVIIQGEQARVSSPWEVYASTAMPNGFPVKNTELEKVLDDYYKSLPPLPYTNHTGQIDNVLTAIETGGQVLIGGEEGRLTIELIMAIYKAGSEQRTIELPIGKDDPFYTVQGIIKNAPHFYRKTGSVPSLAGTIRVSGDVNK